MKNSIKLARLAIKTEINIIRCLYCLLLLTLIFFTFHFSKKEKEETANKIKYQLIAKNGLIAADICSLPDSILKINQIDKLVKQYFILSKAKQPYLLMASGADTVLYSATSTFLLCSIAFGILGFLIAKKGWDNSTNFYLRSSFLILFFASSYFGILIKVFNQKEIGKFNISKYFQFEKLQIQDYTYIRSYEDLKAKGKLSDLDTAFSQINSQMVELNEIMFDIYSDKVPFEFKLDEKH